jgi:uncharacterized alpha-E superfamily protein
MLSRVAERMYWAGRYLERVESTARLVNSYANLILDMPDDITGGWYQLVRIVEAEPLFNEHYDERTELNIQHFLLTDRDNPGSILSSLVFARENFRTSRDIVPTEAWECVNELHLMAAKNLEKSLNQPALRYETLSECVIACQQVAGLLAGTMSLGAPYNFLKAGSHIERADMASRVVDVAATALAHDDPSLAAVENTLWMGVLKSLSAYQMYRQHVRRRVSPPDVVEYLIDDAQFPRAVRHNLDALKACLSAQSRSQAAVSIIGKLTHEISGASFSSMTPADIDVYMRQLQDGLLTLHKAIADTWFHTA